jgi:hypothetical protein
MQCQSGWSSRLPRKRLLNFSITLPSRIQWSERLQERLRPGSLLNTETRESAASQCLRSQIRKSWRTRERESEREGEGEWKEWNKIKWQNNGQNLAGWSIEGWVFETNPQWLNLISPLLFHFISSSQSRKKETPRVKKLKNNGICKHIKNFNFWEQVVPVFWIPKIESAPEIREERCNYPGCLTFFVISQAFFKKNNRNRNKNKNKMEMKKKNG